MRASESHSTLSQFLEEVARPAARPTRREDPHQIQSFQEHVASSSTASDDATPIAQAPRRCTCGSSAPVLSQPVIPNAAVAESQTETAAPKEETLSERGQRTAGEVAAAAARDWGLTDADVKLGYREEVVWFQLGNWINRYIVADTADGQRFEFSADLASTHPDFTARELHVLMREKTDLG